MAFQQQNNYGSEAVPADDTLHRPTPPSLKKRLTAFVLTFTLMIGIWVIFSGKFDALHLSLGIFSTFLISFYGVNLFFPRLDIRKLGGIWIRFLRYFPWLMYQILLANIHLMYLTFHPRMRDLIDPQIISFKSRLKSELAFYTLANSITLTPGTITIQVSVYSDVTFHSIDRESGESGPWDMEARVAEIFGE